jgi:hypothetical protein
MSEFEHIIMNHVTMHGHPELSYYDKNTVTQWESSDSAELFSKHWNNYDSRRKLQTLGWTKHSISYDIDQNGFRNPPHSDISESFLTLGCSYTFGTGLPPEMVWPAQLSKLIDMPVYNCGLAGTSADTAYRIARTVIPLHKPKAVFLLVPDHNRQEIISDFIDDGCPASFSIWGYDESRYGNMGKFVCGEHSQILQQERNILAIEYICDELNIPFYHMLLEDINAPGGIDNDARDLSHSGPECHRVIAEEFEQKFRNQTR